MKKTILIITLLLSGFVVEKAAAQIRFSVNISLQPAWGPVGYDHVEYYYMPDIDVFYYVPRRQYIYQQRGRWIYSTSLPSRFNYNLYNGYKVVINEPQPYRHVETYRTKYAVYKGQRNQEIIRDSRDSKYFQVKGHPQYNKWKNEQRNNNKNNKGKKGKRS